MVPFGRYLELPMANWSIVATHPRLLYIRQGFRRHDVSDPPDEPIFFPGLFDRGYCCFFCP